MELLKLPRTEFSEQLGDAIKQFDEVPVLFRLEEDKNSAVMVGIHNSEAPVPENCFIVPLTSVVEGVVDVNVGTHFANVIGSSGDHWDGGKISWIQVMRNILNVKDLGCIAEKGVIHTNPYNQAKEGAFDNCTHTICGGHILLDKDFAMSIPDNATNLYMLPICSHHNTYYVTGVGTGYYMITKADTKALKLNGYKNKKALELIFSMMESQMTI